MEAADLLKLIGGAGTTGALLWILFKVLTAAGSSWVAAMTKSQDAVVAAADRVAQKMEAHTADERAHQADVQAAIGRLEGKFDATMDHFGRRFTPTDMPALDDDDPKVTPRFRIARGRNPTGDK